MELSDEVLCQRVAARDEAAFNLLVQRYRVRAYRLAWSILRDAEEARDLSQEAFIRLYQTAGRFAGRAKFSTWFYRVVINLCLDHRRRHRLWRRILAPDTREELPSDEPAPSGDPVEELDTEETTRWLWAAVDRLPSQQRMALILVVQERLPIREAAQVLHCSAATVRVHLHRALIALQKAREERRDAVTAFRGRADFIPEG